MPTNTDIVDIVPYTGSINDTGVEMFSKESIAKFQLTTTLACSLPIALISTLILKVLAFKLIKANEVKKMIFVDMTITLITVIGFSIVSSLVNFYIGLIIYMIVGLIAYTTTELLILKNHVNSKVKLIIASLLTSIMVMIVMTTFAYWAYLAGPE